METLKSDDITDRVQASLHHGRIAAHNSDEHARVFADWRVRASTQRTREWILLAWNNGHFFSILVSAGPAFSITVTTQHSVTTCAPLLHSSSNCIFAATLCLRITQHSAHTNARKGVLYHKNTKKEITNTHFYAVRRNPVKRTLQSLAHTPFLSSFLQTHHSSEHT